MRILLIAVRVNLFYLVGGALLIVALDSASALFAPDGLGLILQTHTAWLFLIISSLFVFFLSIWQAWSLTKSKGQHATFQIWSRKNDSLAAEDSAWQEEKKRLSDELVFTQTELNQFSRVVSHYLRAPLANIMGITNLLVQTPLKSGETKAYLRHLQTASHNLDTVIHDMNNMLDLSLSEHGFVEEFDLSQLLSSEVESMAVHTAQVRATVVLQSPVEPLIIKGVRKHYSSIIRELLSNALKFRDPARKTRIVIGAYAKCEMNVLFIRDNGLGFDAVKEKSRIFDMYHRAHFHAEGRGKGLFFVKALTEKCNGKIDVYSQIHNGSIFKISFRKL